MSCLMRAFLQVHHGIWETTQDAARATHQDTAENANRLPLPSQSLKTVNRWWRFKEPIHLQRKYLSRWSLSASRNILSQSWLTHCRRKKIVWESIEMSDLIASKRLSTIGIIDLDSVRTVLLDELYLNSNNQMTQLETVVKHSKSIIMQSRESMSKQTMGYILTMNASKQIIMALRSSEFDDCSSLPLQYIDVINHLLNVFQQELIIV